MSGDDTGPHASRLVDRLRGIAFDLDGTLVDSVPDLTQATNAMLTHCGSRTLSEAQVAELVGGGIEALAARALTVATGAPPATDIVARGLARFHEYYGDHLFERSRVYPGVMAALDALHRQGLALCCVTNKAERFARPLLAAAGIDPLLDSIYCPTRTEERKPAPVLLLRACEALAVEPMQLLCVGDSRTDVGAARAAGCPVAAVAYGYHHGQLHGVDAPDWLIATLTEVIGLPAAIPQPPPEIRSSAASWPADGP